jgi:dihydrolipoamide dehydrogenase
MEERDIVIIGGGPAGYSAAIRASQLGGKVTLVEQDTLGGTCINRGCIPTRTLVRAVELLDMGSKAKDYGITYTDMGIDFTKMNARKDTIVKILVTSVKQVLNGKGVEIIEGKVKLILPSQIELQLKDGMKKELTTRRIILATGSRCKKLSFRGGGTNILNTTQALGLTEIPRSILIVGGGFIGAAFATIFSKLGATVSIVEESSRILPQIDKEIVAILEKEFRANNIQIFTKAHIRSIESGINDDQTILIDINGEAVANTAQYVLLAEAREANIDGLGLDKIGVKLNDMMGIVVNKQMETNVPGILAAGDVTMEHMSTPVAYIEGITAAENAVGWNSEIDYTAIPYGTYTMPEISSVGITEEEALTQGNQIRIGRFPFAGNGMAAVLGQRTGMVKIITDGERGKILGVHIIGPNASDLIAEVSLAMKLNITSEDIRTTFHAHPSLSEALWETAKVVNSTK